MKDDYHFAVKRILEDEYRWHDRKSILNKRRYNIFVVVDVTLAGLISFITLFIDVYPKSKYIIAIMGSIITIGSAFKARFRFHENWVMYRTTAEFLKKQKYLFETGSSPYNDEHKYELLISNINAAIDKENRNWKYSELNDHKPHKTK